MFRYNIIHVLQLVLGFSNGVFASNVSCDVLEFFLGDGYCDAFSNNEQCNYDGGDCCECTCVDGSYYACSSTWNDFSCIDPTSGCLHSRAIEYPNCTGSISALENGSCDQELNNLECGFDGGDCCECSCVDGPDYVCENDSAYLCINPDSDCVDTRVAEFPSCTGNLAYAADGSCDDFNNNPSQKGELFGKVCYGCQDTNCTDCDFVEPNLGPQCISLAEAGIEHASSDGHLSTVEDLLIFKGYWRATNTSTDVKKCYNANACPGGLTTGSCNPGYRGPYCAVCRQGYVASLGFTCNKCSDNTKGIVLAFVFTVTSVAVLATVMFYLMSSEMQVGRRGVVDQLIRRLPVQSVKIVIVAWQILTQFASVANVTFPNVYQDFIDGVNVLNFDLSWVVSPGCFMNYDFYNRLLLTTIGPVSTIGILGVTYAIAERRNRASEVALRTVRQKHASVALLVIFFLYSNVSSVVFQTFSCDPLDDGSSYLRADYSIECYNKKHMAYQIYATIIIFVYPVGIPALFAGLLFRNKQVLQNETRSTEDLVTTSTMSLWEPYKPSRFYYEVIECFRRILLTGVVVFIYPGSAAQIAVTIMMAAVFAMMAEILSPYRSKWDAWVSRAGHALVVTSMYLALLLKVDVSEEESSSEKTFEFILVAANACVVVAVVVEAVAMTCALKETRQHPDPIRRTVRP